MLKIKNVVKSDKKVQLNNIVSVTNNNATYVKMGVASHSQYNEDVSNGKSKYLFYTKNNICLFNAIDETLDFTRFKTIGQEPMICNCIKIHDIFNFYTNGVIQQFYNAFCESHSVSESITLARFLSAIGVEVWKDITCYGGIYKDRYFVSNLGRVFSLNKHVGKILKPYDNSKGYLLVKLCHEGKTQHVYVHRLVALTYYGVPTEKLDACHSNTNKSDNRLFNLELKTHSENLQNPITQKKYKDTIKAKADTPTATATE